MPPTAPVELHLAHTAQGKAVDVHRPAGSSVPLPTVLLWHGVGPDERDVLRPLAGAVAALGALVVVPDWRSDEPDAGRAQLLGSLEWCRANAAGLGGDPEQFVLAGWSAGGSAAVAVALRPGLVDGPRPLAAVSIASRYDLPARTTGTVPLAEPDGGPAGPHVPVRLVHGTGDTLIEPERSREFRAALAARDRPVRLDEPAADHAGVIMTEFDPALGRCRPSEDERVRAAGMVTARVLAEAAGLPVA
ncbi:alpha/beta hydrolase fold domain-containing protein [Streptomyces sp. I05A-00742]|uniref:alpha/beta hydrolase fold domain-containing protein n=1 Tax=Streptomyces sp. I05A-00742 TaxID=2732853 RepID=UPI001489AAE5|nr:alpha/beta hydrolase fold domain-containing protein [Streptomyces sp. I05A-00742]